MSDSIVKSVGRVFEVLELFDTERAALSATSIARTLKYPASSTVALLKSMVNLGYLAYDHNDRMYFPTLRLPLLGAWMESGLYADGHLFQLIDDVHTATNESVFLSWQSDLDMRYVRVRSGLQPDATLPSEASSRVSLFATVSGLLTLSQKRDVDIVKLAERLNAQRRGNEPQVDLPAAMESIRRFRMQGHGIGYDGLVPGYGAIAWVLRRKSAARCYVNLSIFGSTERIKGKEKAFIGAVKAIIQKAGAV
jgi:IclR family KDG regulon transcriptional repressor